MDKSDIKRYLINTLTESEERIKLNLEVNYIHLNKKDIYFELEKYVDNFLDKCNQNKFFVLPGLRGVGKTTILYQLYTYLVKEKGINKNRVLYLDLERFKDEKDLNLIDFFDVFIKDINEENYLTTIPLFIFVDESQHAPNWASCGKIVYDDNVNVFLIFTGSNAINLEYNADAARRLVKKEVYPLNFREYLEIKYDLDFPENIDETMYNMIISGDINKISSVEKNIQINTFPDIKRDISKEWEEYLQYGTLPFTLNEEKINSIPKTLEIKDKIIEQDMTQLTSIKTKTRLSAYYLIKDLAIIKPGEYSLNNMADNLELDKNTVKELLDTLEKTRLIFHYEPYASTTKRTRSIGKYYFLATQIKAAFFLNKGDISNVYNQVLGNLLENLIAASLFKIKNDKQDGFGVYIDSDKGGVDFIIKTFHDTAIPIEVGIGNKNKKQIKKAIKKYNAKYGIVISNHTNYITKEEDVIFIPPITFSLI